MLTQFSSHRAFSPELEQADLSKSFAEYLKEKNPIGVVAWLEIGQVDVNADLGDGETPLHVAVSIPGGIYLVGRLLDKDADPNLSDSNGWTPIHNVCRPDFWNPDVLALLVGRGGDIHAKTNQGCTPLDLVIREFDSSNVAEAIEKLLTHGADLTQRDLQGNTPFLSAAEHGSPRATRHLAEKKEGLLEKNLQGRNAFHQALHSKCANEQLEALIPRYNREEKIRLLNEVDTSSYTPVGYAALKHPELVDRLVREGGRIDVSIGKGSDTIEQFLRRNSELPPEEIDALVALQSALIEPPVEETNNPQPTAPINSCSLAGRSAGLCLTLPVYLVGKMAKHIIDIPSAFVADFKNQHENLVFRTVYAITWAPVKTVVMAIYQIARTIIYSVSLFFLGLYGIFAPQHATTFIQSVAKDWGDDVLLPFIGLDRV